MKVGSKVAVSNFSQINYRREGIVIEEDISTDIHMSKVKFVHVECWYYDVDLEYLGIPDAVDFYEIINGFEFKWWTKELYRTLKERDQ